MPLSKRDQFIQAIMPDAPVGARGFTANPRELPGEAREILEAVKCATGVPMNYLEHAAGLVLRGLAGLKCLWFLHGLKGRVENTRPQMEVSPSPAWFGPMLYDWVAAKRATGRFEAGRWGTEWLEGKAIFLDWSDPKTGKVKPRVEERIGKILRESHATKEQMKEFETRIKPPQTHWNWRISAHPYDVLTMSFDRSWTSCMRPGGEAPLGPLTDMAAGAACIFWYRPGADQPCGRTILRPSVDINTGSNKYQPEVNIAPSVKGAGPRPFNALAFSLDIATACHARDGTCPVRFVSDDHAQLGDEGMALSRNIHDDFSRQFCHQDDDAYQEAYARLKAVEWPEPKLADLDLRATITPELIFQLGGEEGSPEVPTPAEVVERLYGDDYFGNMDLDSRLRDYFSDDHNSDVPEEWEDVSDDIDWNVVGEMVKARILSELDGRFSHEPTQVVLVPYGRVVLPEVDPRQLGFPLEAMQLPSPEEVEAENQRRAALAQESWEKFIDRHAVTGSYGGSNLAFMQRPQPGSYMMQHEGNYEGWENWPQYKTAAKIEELLRAKGWPLENFLPFFVTSTHDWTTALAKAPGDHWNEVAENETFADAVEEFEDGLAARPTIIQLERGEVSGSDWVALLLGVAV